MNFLYKLFRAELTTETNKRNLVEMNAKEKQLFFIKNSLKPLFKFEGFKTAGNKWWKIDEPFFNLIELQNFSWNLRNSVDFCFNFTTGFTKDIKNLNKPTIHDGIPYIREAYFHVPKNDYWRGGNGYHIDDSTDLEKFTEHILNDFKSVIFPKLNLLIDEDAILNFYSDKFWGPRVKQSLKLGCKDLKIDN